MVPVWSSGFIVGTLAVRHAPGLSILFWRMTVAALVMGAIAMAMRAPWPRERGAIVQMVAVGLLLQAAQFVGIFLALQHGVPAGLTALLAGSSPLLVAVLATFLLDEHLTPVQWIGSVIGVTGVVLAVIEELHGGGSALGFFFAVVGLAGLVGGTLVQRARGLRHRSESGKHDPARHRRGRDHPDRGVHPGIRPERRGARTARLADLRPLDRSGDALLLAASREKSGEATSFLYLVPATTAIAGVPILGQPLSVGAVIGLVFALIGVRMVSAPAEGLSSGEWVRRFALPGRLNRGST